MLILLLVLLLLLERRKAKMRLAEQEEALLAQQEEEAQLAEAEQTGEEGGNENTLLESAASLERMKMMDKDEEMRQNEEILNLRMKHSLKLKQNIGEFVDENPQIAAKLIQNWLLGEGEDNGRNGRK